MLHQTLLRRSVRLFNERREKGRERVGESGEYCDPRWPVRPSTITFREYRGTKEEKNGGEAQWETTVIRMGKTARQSFLLDFGGGGGVDQPVRRVQRGTRSPTPLRFLQKKKEGGERKKKKKKANSWEKETKKERGTKRGSEEEFALLFESYAEGKGEGGGGRDENTCGPASIPLILLPEKEKKKKGEEGGNERTALLTNHFFLGKRGKKGEGIGGREERTHKKDPRFYSIALDIVD